MSEIHVLVVDDEKEIADLVEIYLVSDGYKVYKASNALEGLEILEKETIHLVLLDIMMPGMDGLEMCRKIRETNNIPIIMLSARSADLDKILGLGTGADDYVTKPFGMMELVSRIKAVLRRSRKTEEKSQIELSGVCMNIKKHDVTVNGKEVALTLKEFELLEKLMRNEGIVLTRDQLLTEIWGYDFDGETRTVDVHVRTLRQKLGEAGACIETVRGVGYRMGDEA